MAIRPPPPNVPLVGAGGKINPDWYDFFVGLTRVGLSGLPDVKLTALADTQVLIWNAADGKWENGAN